MLYPVIAQFEPIAPGDQLRVAAELVVEAAAREVGGLGTVEQTADSEWRGLFPPHATGPMRLAGKTARERSISRVEFRARLGKKTKTQRANPDIGKSAWNLWGRPDANFSSVLRPASA